MSVKNFAVSKKSTSEIKNNISRPKIRQPLNVLGNKRKFLIRSNRKLTINLNLMNAKCRAAVAGDLYLTCSKC